MKTLFKSLAVLITITIVAFAGFTFPEAKASPSNIRMNQGQTVTGTLAAGSYQYLWFAGQANTPITFSLGKSGDLWYRFKILDTSGKKVLYQADVETYEREISYTPQKTANYYVLLTGYYSYGKFELRLKNIFATNQQTSISETALQYGSNRNEDMATGVIRRYSFSGKENEPLRITLSTEKGLWYRFKILDSSGRTLTQADVESYGREIIFTPNGDGQLHITVSGYYGTGKFGIKLDRVKDIL